MSSTGKASSPRPKIPRYTSLMCASWVTTTSSASCSQKICAATAASEETGTISSPDPNASPCATDAAIRMPMNEPGPFPSTIASRSVSSTDVSCNSSWIIGTSRRVCSRGCSSCRSAMSPPCCNATEQATDEVSIASRFMQRRPCAHVLAENERLHRLMR